MIELHLNTRSLSKGQCKELLEWVNLTRMGRYGSIDVLWSRDDLLLRFYQNEDVLAFKLRYDYNKLTSII